MEQKINSVSLECRDMRHAWMQVKDVVLTEKKGIVRIFTRTLRCLRCETERVDTYEVVSRSSNPSVAQRVDLLHTKYKYPDGYQVKGRVNVSTVREMLWHDRLLNGVSE
jgi:hypothetical protein